MPHNPSIAVRYVQDKVLEPGEHIVWHGRPSSFHAAMRSWYPVVVGFVVLGLAPLLVVVVPGELLMFLIPFSILVAIGSLTQPVREVHRAVRCQYFVTDRRILIVTAGSLLKNAMSIFPSDIRDVEQSQIGPLAGNVTFRHVNGHRLTWLSGPLDFADGFWSVADPDGAARAIAALKATEQGAAA